MASVNNNVPTNLFYSNPRWDGVTLTISAKQNGFDFELLKSSTFDGVYAAFDPVFKVYGGVHVAMCELPFEDDVFYVKARSIRKDDDVVSELSASYLKIDPDSLRKFAKHPLYFLSKIKENTDS